MAAADKLPAGEARLRIERVGSASFRLCVCACDDIYRLAPIMLHRQLVQGRCRCGCASPQAAYVISRIGDETGGG